MKVLVIESCENCPYFKAEPLHNIDDAYLAICQHPDIDKFAWQQKIRNEPTPPPMCPLPDFNH